MSEPGFCRECGHSQFHHLVTGCVYVVDEDPVSTRGTHKTYCQCAIWQHPDEPPVSDPVPVEGIVWPERPKMFTDGGLHETWRAEQVEAHFTLLETKLADAIAQRDAARTDRDMTQVSFGKILLEANQWKDRATKAEELLREHKTTYDLNLATLQRNHEIDRADWEPVLIERVRVAEAALAAMTEDRNLWQNAHDEDCPSKAALAAECARNFKV